MWKPAVRPPTYYWPPTDGSWQRYCNERSDAMTGTDETQVEMPTEEGPPAEEAPAEAPAEGEPEEPPTKG